MVYVCGVQPLFLIFSFLLLLFFLYFIIIIIIISVGVPFISKTRRRMTRRSKQEKLVQQHRPRVAVES